MKKILLIASALLFAVSCSQWSDGSEVKTVRYVDKLLFADGRSVTFNYSSYDTGTVLVSSIAYSDGRVIDVSYENLGTYTPTIWINDGVTSQQLKFESGCVRAVVESGREVVTMSYTMNNTFLSNLTNDVQHSNTVYSIYNSCFTDIVSEWYLNASKHADEIVKSQIVRLGHDYQISNYLSSVDLLQFIVPEFSQTMGLDPAVVASIGITSFRSYYLPYGASIMTSSYDVLDSDDDVDAQAVGPVEGTTVTEIRRISYERDNDGYVTKVYTSIGDAAEASVLFSVVYKTMSE